MKAMILAAGRGERMRPLTDQFPKPLLKAGGKPLLQWHIEALVRAGFTDIVVNCAHLADQVAAFLGDGSQLGARITCSREAVALETAGGIRKALEWLKPDPFFVVNGDVFTDLDYRCAASVIQSLPSAGLAHLWLVDNPQHHPGGDFALSCDGRVAAPDDDRFRAQPVYTFSGLGVYRPALFEGLELNRPEKLAPLLRAAMGKGAVTGAHHPGLWMDIGTPERLQALNEYLNGKKEAV